MGQFDCGYGAWIPGPILDDPGLRPRSLILYARIARRANRVGFCYATNATLINDMTSVDENGAMRVLSERTIQSMLAELQERGHIRTDNGPFPPDKNGVVRTGRRIYIGRSLAAPTEALDGGEENFTPEKNFTQGVKKSSPPIIGIKEEKKNNTPLYPPKGDGAGKKRKSKSVPDWKPERFERFWEFYRTHARDEDRAGAVRAWDSLRPDDGLIDTMAKALAVQVETDEWKRGIGIPYACRWIRNERWKDTGLAAARKPEEPAEPPRRRYVGKRIIDGQEVDVYE